MGHMDDDNLPHYTISVRYRFGDATGEVFNHCTEVDSNDDQLSFTDQNGKTHEFYNVSYHVAQE
jgi:hypothetical protein